MVSGNRDEVGRRNPVFPMKNAFRNLVKIR
jgi:hypothetical protein